MNRLQKRFDELQSAGQKVLVPYITGGYPDPETTVEILKKLDPTKVGCVELGIPFSDPIADGPVIQTSFYRALDRGFKIGALFAALKAARGEIAVPLVAMVSYTLIFRRDPEQFVVAAQEAGIDGLLVPDLSIEEADALNEVCVKHDYPLVMIIAPTSPIERRKKIAELSRPWIYYQSLAGVTGERSALPTDLASHVTELKQETGKPICVGFGISQPEHVAAVCQVADGAIVGSAIVRRMNEGVEANEPREKIVERVVSFIHELTVAIV